MVACLKGIHTLRYYGKMIVASGSRRSVAAMQTYGTALFVLLKAFVHVFGVRDLKVVREKHWAAF